MSEKIKHQVTYGFPETTAYKSITEGSNELEALLKKKINQLRKKGIDKEKIPEYLESIVDTYIITQQNALAHEHSRRQRHIEYTFQQRKFQGADRKRSLELIEVEITETAAELELVKKLEQSFNPFCLKKPITEPNDEDEIGEIDNEQIDSV